MKIFLFALLLTLAGSCSRVTGVVVDHNGAPLAGASVSVDCSKTVKKTSASGRFRYSAKCPAFTKTTTLRVTYGGKTRVFGNVKFKKPVEVEFDLR